MEDGRIRDATYSKGLKNFIQDRDLFIDRAHLWHYVGLSSAERMAGEAPAA